MSPWWISASSILVVAGALVGAISWRVSREVDALTRSVVALRVCRSEVRSIEASRSLGIEPRWADLPEPRR